MCMVALLKDAVPRQRGDVHDSTNVRLLCFGQRDDGRRSTDERC